MRWGISNHGITLIPVYGCSLSVWYKAMHTLTLLNQIFAIVDSNQKNKVFIYSRITMYIFLLTMNVRVNHLTLHYFFVYTL